MTLRKKTLLIQAAIFIVLLLLLDLTFTNFLRRSAGQLAEQRMEQDMARAQAALDGESQALYAVSEIWANSDATWYFMSGLNQSFADTYLDRSVMKTLGISSMVFFDNKYNVRLFKDYSTEDDPSAPENEFEAIIMDSIEIGAQLAEIPVSGIKGIADSDGKPILFSIQPIFNSSMDSERAGYLLMTRTATPNLIKRLSQNLGFGFALVPANEKETADGVSQDMVVVRERDNDAISGRRLIRDIGGRPAFWITMGARKADGFGYERRLQLMFLAFAAVGFCFCLLNDRILKRLIWDRLSRIQKEIQEAQGGSLGEHHMTDDGRRDELSDLARAIGDSYAFINFSRESKQKLDDITAAVNERFSQAGVRLCNKMLEDVATAFTPRDESFRSSIIRMSKKTLEFAGRMGIGEEEGLYVYIGALFSRIGLLGLPFAARKKKWELSEQELREYQKYPVFSREFMKSVELLRYAADIPYSWKEKWDGTGFPRGLSGAAIPFEARIFAVVNEWNELTRARPGRKPPADRELEDKLLERAGTRLDPNLVDEFIKFLNETKGDGGNSNE